MTKTPGTAVNNAVPEVILSARVPKNIFVPKGKSIALEFSIPAEARVEARITQCKSFPVFEVFQCTPEAVQTIHIQGNTQGKESYYVKDTAFYRFEHIVVLPDYRLFKPIEQHEIFDSIRVMWRRG